MLTALYNPIIAEVYSCNYRKVDPNMCDTVLGQKF
jgi:hypothetical protein